MNKCKCNITAHAILLYSIFSWRHPTLDSKSHFGLIFLDVGCCFDEAGCFYMAAVKLIRNVSWSWLLCIVYFSSRFSCAEGEAIFIHSIFTLFAECVLMLEAVALSERVYLNSQDTGCFSMISTSWWLCSQLLSLFFFSVSCWSSVGLLFTALHGIKLSLHTCLTLSVCIQVWQMVWIKPNNRSLK